MSTRSMVAAALALGLVAAACGGGAEDDPAITGGGEGEGEATITVAGEEANDRGTADIAGGGDIEVEMDDFYFEPTVLSGEAGQTLTVSLFNEGDNPHTFTIEDQDVDAVLDPGQEGVTAEVVFPQSGAVLFVCRFHAAQGMRGALSVGGDLGPAPDGGDSPDGGGSPDRSDEDRY